jgi:hypothetical protein
MFFYVRWHGHVMRSSTLSGIEDGSESYGSKSPKANEGLCFCPLRYVEK